MTEEIPQLETIVDYSDKDKLAILDDICSRIYIARNISLRHDIIIKQLERIDTLFRDNEIQNYN